ncbi:hypothetical protein [Corynebacterium stationis]|uniref:hypothetical protein n=1 Tax=Corynebacterium stationis TaxID=1705 RepID=UPI00099BA533|nr:hypothetical protein [Corynebacterium stationis]AQX70123.1 hypothetical protein CA21670_00305 [Corynebacterium stationis]
MPWLRVGDNIATHPIMSKLLVSTKLDHQAKNECFGVLAQLAATSAAHLTDGITEMGLLAQIAPGRERIVLEHLKKAGIAKELENEGHLVIELILDDEEFLHIRRKEEVEQDRNRKKDQRTPGLYARVRVRDGDCCRWCGKSISWTSRSGYRAGTYDSTTNHKNSTIDTIFVACQPCNSARGGGVDLSLLPAPERPIYGKHTVDFVNNDAWCKDHGVKIALTQPTLPLEEGTTKIADTPRSTESVARWEQTGASAVEPEPVEMPEWVEASPDRMNELWSQPEESLRSTESVARWQTPQASEPEQTPSHDFGGTVADTSRSTGSVARWEQTGAPQNQSHDQGHDSSKAADTARSTESVARWQTTGALEDESTSEGGHKKCPRSDPGRKGDAAGNVGSGRDGSVRLGTARQGQGSVRRSRRGKRGRSK